jgi:hypothetical protein
MPVKVAPLLGAAAIIAGCAGGAVALLKVAGGDEDDRPVRQSTTAPSAGFDRQPNETPPAPEETTTTTTAPPEDEGPPVVLRADGIGAFRFAAAPDEVIAGLTLRWGPPDGDTGWIAAGGSPFGVCPGTVVRGVNWRGFTVLFSDGRTPWAPAGRRHLFTWQYAVDDPARPAPDPGGNRPRLQTPTGASIGSTVQGLRQVYGEALELFDEPPAGPQFGVETGEGGLLYGSVTGHDPAGVVVSMVGGGGCGE